MIDEKRFIEKLKMYDVTGYEFDSLEQINQTIDGSMQPLRKRGVNENEYTFINLDGYEPVNDDTVLHLFNIIPPGPKVLHRARTYVIVGRYTQAIVPIFVLKTEDAQEPWILVQTRNPLTLGYATITEIYREYVKQTDPAILFNNFYTELTKELDSDFKIESSANLGYFWEDTSVESSNLNVCVAIAKAKSKDKVLEQIQKNVSKFESIIGDRELDFISLDKLDTMINDYISLTALYSLKAYLRKQLNDL